MEPLTPIELLATAVLKGDKAAIRGFLDMLNENISNGLMLIPVKYIQVNRNRLRVVAYFPMPDPDNPFEVDEVAARTAIDNWLDNPGTHLYLVGVERIEIFEFPEGM